MSEQNFTEHDISNEAFREYIYADGRVFEIIEPQTLYITAGGGHRVVCAEGVTHRPERGYVGIRWRQHDGKPFSF